MLRGRLCPPLVQVKYVLKHSCYAHVFKLLNQPSPDSLCVVLVCCIRLDLDKWIYEPPSDSEEDFKANDLTFMLGSGGGGNDQFTSHVPRSKKGKKRRGKKGAEEVDGEESEDEEDMKKVSQC